MPWLNLYPKNVSEKMTAPTPAPMMVPPTGPPPLLPNLFPSVANAGPKPPFEAELQILVEILEDIDKLEFEYDKTVFTINKPILLSDKTVCAKKISGDHTVKITCASTDASFDGFSGNREIKVWAYPKGIMAKSRAEQMMARKLAGQIMVCANDAHNRRKQKFVLVPIRTNINNLGFGQIGDFKTVDKNTIANVLHQALVQAEIEDYSSSGINGGVLDLTNDNNLKIITSANGNSVYGKYIDSNTGRINEDYTNSELFTYLQSKFFNHPSNVKYKNGNYFTAFAFGEVPYDADPSTGLGAMGQIQHVSIHNMVIFKNRKDTTFAHEGLHGFGLQHTHRNGSPIKEPDRKFVFPQGDTDNIMSYSEGRKTTWKWQWDLIKSKLP